MSRYSTRWSGEDSERTPATPSLPRSPVVTTENPTAPSAPADEPLSDQQLLALRTSVYVTGTALAQAARAFGISVNSAARYCSADTRFLGRWPDSITSVPPLAIVRARA